MFNPQTEQHDTFNCTCEDPADPTNLEPPADDISMTVEAYGERLRQSQERIRLARDWAQELWKKGFRNRCLWINVLNMYEPPSWSNEYNIWKEVKASIA